MSYYSIESILKRNIASVQKRENYLKELQSFDMVGDTINLRLEAQKFMNETDLNYTDQEYMSKIEEYAKTERYLKKKYKKIQKIGITKIIFELVELQDTLRYLQRELGFKYNHI